MLNIAFQHVQDLAEIERELEKYQHLLGHVQVDLTFLVSCNAQSNESTRPATGVRRAGLARRLA